ncbi:uncharacterized protein LOC114123496 [Aphis gossypii]|uniref:uncharacterized protein LOC114123496 n=1 Tax=Aphis gossypii TaxID=80765 RepID=UPI00215920BE|nr:uncharacterized protein LOC114123496 [Aphis gossypii]
MTSTTATTITAASSSKWVWRPRWTEWTTTSWCRPTFCSHREVHDDREPVDPSLPAGRSRPVRRRASQRSSFASSKFALAIVSMLMMLTTVVEDARALGFFELQILEIENYRGQLATGECCGSDSSSSAQQQPSSAQRNTLQCTGAPQCNTLFQVCLREYQSRHQQQQPSGSSSASAGSRVVIGDDESSFIGSNHHQTPNSHLHHCSFGNVTSPVLGGNSFTLGGDAAAASSDTNSPADFSNRGAAGGNLALQFTFSWTRSFTLVLQAMDYNNYTGLTSVIEEATYSGILLPGNEWKALSYLGHTARMAYRVRVRCDRNYYGQNCTKLCKPRDDRFGHYTCGDTDGRKECIPGWQGDTCDIAVCKTGCHPVHGKCESPGDCECRKGWQGELCDQCMTYPGCKHGYCNGTSWQCICDVNWGGILCDQDLNYCGTHEPCLNGGTCKSTAPDRYTCTCPEGFGGANCDVVLNPCATEPCANGGKCRTVDAVTSTVGGAGGAGPGPAAGGAPTFGSAAQSAPLLVPKQFHCDCRPGWMGSTCNTEIDECATQPPRCLNGGSCIDLVADWRCACADDRWRGRRCEIDVDECERQHRERQTAVIEQQCGPNAVPCRTTGGGSNVAVTTECVCRRGWTTAASMTASRDGHNGTLACTVNVDDCAGPDVKCANGGTCLDLIGGYACACPVGFTGRNCRTQIDPCGGDGESGVAGNGNPCKNGGECVPLRRWRSGGGSGLSAKQQQQQQTYSCICPLGYSGENCEIDRDHCTPNPCRNGGQCLNTPDDYYCQCSGDGWSWHGKNCTVPADVAGAGATRSTAVTTTTTLTTRTTTTTTTTAAPTTTTTTSIRPPLTPPLQRSTAITPVATVRRPGAGVPGTMTWRQQQKQHGDGDDDAKASTVANADQQQNDDDGSTTMCGGSRHRRKHWIADDGCNECKCSSKSSAVDNVEDKSAVMSCTNMWCGPATFDCLSGVMPCTGTNQVCIPIVDDMDDEELLDDELDKRGDSEGTTAAVDNLLLWRQCLRPPCGGVDADRDRDDVRLRYGYDEDGGSQDDHNAYVAVGSWPRRRRRGQCATAVVDDGDMDDDDDDDDDDDGAATTVWPSAVQHCLPNGVAGDKRAPHQQHRHRRGDACGRLRVTLDPARLRRGTRVSAVCHSLRRLLAREWVRGADDDGLSQEDDIEYRRNRVYVMCEAADDQRDNIDEDRSGGAGTGNGGNTRRRRRRRRVTIRVSVAVVSDKQRRITATGAEDDDVDVATVVGRAVQTLYKRLNSGNVGGSTAASTKKIQSIGHRLRPTVNSGAEDYDDAAALAFLIAAVVDVTLGGGTTAESHSTPVPANSSGSSDDDYRHYYYYYWTIGVACGALATVLAAAAFLLLRFRSSVRRKSNAEQAVSDSSAAAVDPSVPGGDSLMLSLVRRQNEENLKRLVTGGNRIAVTAAGGDYGGSGCGRNNLSAGSSLSCSRVSIVHPLCNVTSADDGSSLELNGKQHQPNADADGMNVDDEKSGEKTNVAPPPVAAVRSVAVAAPRQQQQQQQQRPLAVATPQPLLLCKKTLNVDNEQRRQLQLMQQQRQQQQQQPIHHQQTPQQQQPINHHQQQQLMQQQQVTAAQQYNRRSRGDVHNQQVLPNQQQYHNQQQQQQHYTTSLLHSSAPANNNSNNNNHSSGDGNDEAAGTPSLTVLV